MMRLPTPGHSPFAKNLAHMLYGNFALVVLQGVQFIVLARMLGPKEFGMFASTAALVMIAMPFSGFGLPNVTIMRGSRDAGAIPAYLTASIAGTAISAALLSILLVLVAPPLLGRATTVTLTAWICVTELFFTKLMDACGHAFVAAQEMHRTSQFMLLPCLLRLAFLGFFVYHGSLTVETWVVFTAAAHGIAFSIAAYLTLCRFGAAAFDFGIIRSEWKNGFHFACILTSKSIFTDSDKAILGRLAGPEAAGIYTWASRVIQISLVPVNALIQTVQARLFDEGRHGVAGSWNSGYRLLQANLIYGLAAGAAIWLCAPIVSFILGDGFSDTAHALRWMVLLPALSAAQGALVSVVASGGEPEMASAIYGIAAFVTLVGCFLCVGWFGWYGAIVANYVAQLGLVGMLATIVQLRIKSGGVDHLPQRKKCS